jgi:hypothetical protein
MPKHAVGMMLSNDSVTANTFIHIYSGKSCGQAPQIRFNQLIRKDIYGVRELQASIVKIWDKQIPAFLFLIKSRTNTAYENSRLEISCKTSRIAAKVLAAKDFFPLFTSRVNNFVDNSALTSINLNIYAGFNRLLN